jgi:ribosome-binding factor A
LKAPNNRLLRVGENIRAVLSKHIISEELYIKHLKNTIITITEVRPSKDLRHAKVFVSSVGGNEEKVADALNNSSNFFSKIVAKEIDTKYSPKLFFVPDLVHKRATLINKIMKKKQNEK